MKAAPNKYEIRGETTVLFLRRRNAPPVECLIDTTDLPKIVGLGRSWCLQVRGNVGCKLAGGGHLKLHRWLLDAAVSLQVDHINRNELDNRRANLRLATNQQNHCNRKPRPENNKTGFRCVHLNALTGKYLAKVRRNYHYINLGTAYSTPEQASAAVEEFFRQEGISYAG